MTSAKKLDDGLASTPKHNIPRSKAEALRQGLTKLPMRLNEVSATEKANWLIFKDAPKRSRAPCAVTPLANGHFKICFVDPATGECNGDCFESVRPG